MLVHSRTLAILILLANSAASLAQDRQKPAAGPMVPAFTRFHADDKLSFAAGGRLLLGELNCARCHTSEAADLKEKTAPILDGVGERIKRTYLRAFLSDPHKTKPGTKMPDVFAGLAEADRKAEVEALVHYLASTGSTTLARLDTKGIEAGRDLYHKVGCVSCHGSRDAKGDQDAMVAGSVPLGNLKSKYTLGSLKSFLENPQLTRPAGRMPGLLNAKEAIQVANFLMQGTPGLPAQNMNFAYYEGKFSNVPDFGKLKPKATGETTDFDLRVKKRNDYCALKFDGVVSFVKDGNYTFHTRSDDGSKLWIDDKLVVNNDGVHAPQAKSGKILLDKGIHRLTVAVFNAAGGFELSVDVEGPGMERQPLGPHVFLNEEALKPKAVENDPEAFPLQPALIAQGKEFFGTMGCANCHQLNDQTPRITAAPLAQLKGTGGCLDASPQKGSPWFGLADIQRTALKSSLKSSDKVDAKGEIVRTLMRFNCYACHERDKIGGAEEALNKFFQTSQQEMGDEGRIPPSLTGVGAKMNPEYLKKILADGSHDRPYMQTRMPKFGDANVGHLVALLGSVDTPDPAPKVTIDEPMNKVKSVGRDLVGSKFGCIKCHTFAGAKAEGVQGIDMAIMTQRVKKEWFHNYIIDPAKYRPGTRMPSSFPNGETLLTKILDGSAPAQIEAIWTYLADGKGAILPPGTNKSSIPLIPGAEAIIYRNFIQGAGPRAIGVGYPEKAHLAFDANDCRLAMLWQNAFMDARRHWTDRGVGFEPPMGDNILHLPSGPAFATLTKIDEDWPAKSGKSLGYQFRGYRLADDQRPTFMYSYGDVAIDDFPNAVETKAGPTMRRTFTLTSEGPADKLYYRAAVGEKIEPIKDGWYRINDWRMRIESDQAPIIRRSGDKVELVVPVRFKDHKAKIVQEYAW